MPSSQRSSFLSIGSLGSQREPGTAPPRPAPGFRTDQAVRCGLLCSRWRSPRPGRAERESRRLEGLLELSGAGPQTPRALAGERRPASSGARKGNRPVRFGKVIEAMRGRSWGCGVSRWVHSASHAHRWARSWRRRRRSRPRVWTRSGTRTTSYTGSRPASGRPTSTRWPRRSPPRTPSSIRCR